MSLSLEYLQTKHNLSVRSYNVCHVNKLIDLGSIIAYYKKEKAFTRLRNCGSRTDIELKSLCSEYLDALFCKKSNITTLNDLIEYTQLQETVNLPTGLQNTFSLYKILNDKNVEEDEFFVEFKDFELNRILSIKFESEVKHLDKRSENVAMRLWHKHNRNIRDIFLYLHSINFSYKKISNIGKKSADTLELFFNNLLDYAEKAKDQSPAQRDYALFLAKVNICIKNISGKTLEWLVEKEVDYHNNFFPFSEFIYVLLENGDIFDDKQTYIFLNGTKYFHGKRPTLDKLGQKFDISRERVRQILINDRFHNLMFNNNIIHLLNILTPQRVELEVEADINDNLISFEDLDESSRFTKYFYYKLYSRLYYKQFTPVIDDDPIYPKYLINRKIADSILWNKLLKKIRTLVDKKTEESYQLNLKGLLYSFSENSESLAENQVDVLNTLEELIYEEFGLLTDLEGNITIQRTTRKLTYEYIIDVLEEANEPLHADEIYKKLELTNPGVIKSVESVRSQLQRRQHFIIVSGSNYGLKKWENEGRYIGGKIKDLVVHYLRTFETPKHIQDIADFVIQHRNTNKRNVDGNLRSDPRNKFKSFGLGFFGLTEKSYFEDDMQFNPIPNTSMRFLQRDYFENGKSIDTFDKLIVKFAEANDIFPVQVRSLLLDKIKDGKLLLTDNYLYINDK